MVPTSRDVALRAGVSRATVSAVVNGTRFVSPDLRTRVERAVAELRYQPDALARSLKTRKAYAVGVVIPTVYSPFYADLVSGIEQTLSQHDYSLMLCSSNENPGREAELLKLLTQKRIDGLLLITCCSQTGPMVLDLVARGMPVVLLDRRIPGLRVDTVVTDSHAAGYKACQHLIEAGCRRIAMITFSLEASSSAERVAGYRAALAANVLGADVELLGVVCDSEGEGAYDEVLRILSLPEPPDGLILCSQRVTAPALRGLKDRHVIIPAQIKVVGFDDSAWAPLMCPALTVIDQPAGEMGSVAARLLLQRIDQPGHGSPQQIMLETRLVQRESCGHQ
jgi:LacI family transcriptional regulator